jgi:molybdopterin-biosynthesis enzyme MoeA-like protein
LRNANSVTISKAPGFRLGNVIVMAGVPAIMQAMLDGVAPTLQTGAVMVSRSCDGRGLPEGDYATPLGEVQKAHPGVMIGSYPSFDGQRFTNQIVLRSRDQDLLDRAADAVAAMLEQLAAQRQASPAPPPPASQAT